MCKITICSMPRVVVYDWDKSVRPGCSVHLGKIHSLRSLVKKLIVFGGALMTSVSVREGNDYAKGNNVTLDEVKIYMLLIWCCLIYVLF